MSTDKATIVALRRRQRRVSPSASSTPIDKSSTQAEATASLLAHVRQAVSTDLTGADRPPTTKPKTTKKPPLDPAKTRPILSTRNEGTRQTQEPASNDLLLKDQTNDPANDDPKTDPIEPPPPKIIQTVPSSVRKRPLFPIDTNPPRIVPHRFVPFLAGALPHSCLNTTADALVEDPSNAAWQLCCEDEIVRFGASQVRWRNANKEYLNITARSNHDDSRIHMSVSTTWDANDPSTLWTLHSTSEIIPVGNVEPLSDERTTSNAEVRLTQGFALRNIEWNGILQSTTLSLVTDAHGQPDVADDEDEGEHPMSRLWHAHRLIPSLNEIWYAGERPNPSYFDDIEDEKLDQRFFGRTEAPITNTTIPKDPAVQETILLDELLGACLGLSGKHIIADENGSFQLHGGTSWDTILHTCIVDLLDIPTAFRLVDLWLSRQRHHHECSVRRTLYEYMQSSMDEYLELILSQYRNYRNGSLSIHSLQALYPARRQMNEMADVVCRIASSCGGALIQTLPRTAQYFIDAAMVPYREQLHIWLTQGRLVQPHHFMIQRNAAAKCWAEEYVVCHDHVLTNVLPTTRLVQQTLETGRYWNAVRSCQTIPIVSPNPTIALASFVESQHEQASNALKSLLLPDLQPSLQLIQEYFLMYNADMYLSFLNKVSPELGKDIELVSRHRVQHFFDEPGIQCYFRLEGSNQMVKSVQGIDAFAIRLSNLSFPSDILLTKQVMADYTSLFQHLFRVKYAEQKLLAVWKDHQLTKDVPFVSCLRSTFALRHRMLHFVDNLNNYIRGEVVEVQWEAFLGNLNKDLNSVDDMLQIQQQFLESVLEACILKDRKARNSLLKLINTCISFTVQMDNFHDATQLTAQEPSRRRVIAIDNTPPSAKLCRERLEAAQELRERRRDIQSSRIRHEANSESYQNMVTRFSEVYDRRLHDFVANLSAQHISLRIRLNFNGFMTNRE